MIMRERLIELIKKAEIEFMHSILSDFDLLDYLADYLLSNGVIVLPCAIDTKVWVLGQPCGGCSCYNEPMKEEFIEICRKCDLWEIGECSFDYDLIPEFGKTVFLTKEAAENALRAKTAVSLIDGHVEG